MRTLCGMISVCLICLRLYLKMSISLIVRSIKLSARRHGSGDAFLRTAFFQRLIYQTHILEHGEADKIIANKFGKTFEGSYITNAVFDHCKIKGCTFFCLYMENVRFIGLIDDLMIRKMSVKDITRYQTPAKALEIISKILRVTHLDDIDVPKVQVKDIDFSMATMQFLDFSECELKNIIPPADNKHLLIDNDLHEITKYVSDEIKKSWYNADNRKH